MKKEKMVKKSNSLKLFDSSISSSSSSSSSRNDDKNSKVI